MRSALAILLGLALTAQLAIGIGIGAAGSAHSLARLVAGSDRPMTEAPAQETAS